MTQSAKTSGNSALAAENKLLKAELKEAKDTITRLEQYIARTRLDETEIALLRKIADCIIDDSFEVTFAEDSKLSKPRLDYHLERLVNAGCVEVLFVDPELGENFAITEDGRQLLVTKQLL